MLRADLLIFLLSAVIGYIVLYIRLRRREEGVWIKDAYVTSLGIGFFIWKFSMLFFDPLEVFKNPASLLYFTGGQRGVWLGTLGGLAYLAYKAYRNRPIVHFLIKSLVLAYAAVQTVRFTLLILWGEAAGWGLPLCAFVSLSIWIAAWLKFESPLKSFLPLVLWYSIGSAFIPFLDENRFVIWLGFSLEQLLFVLIAVILLVIESLGNRRS